MIKAPKIIKRESEKEFFIEILSNISVLLTKHTLFRLNTDQKRDF